MRRPLSRHIPMSIGHRAKIFAPFAALSGFEDCVHAREERYLPQPELSPEREAELNTILRLLQYHDEVSAIYFRKASFKKAPDLLAATCPSAKCSPTALNTRSDISPTAASLPSSLADASPLAVNSPPVGQYKKISGPLEWIHPLDRCLKIASVEINFDDLIDLQNLSATVSAGSS